MAKKNIIGRINECRIIDNLLQEKEAQMIAVYGRRRVGKTFLVRQYFDNKFHFSITGMYNANTALQLAMFHTAMKQYTSTSTLPKTWFEAFEQLKDYLMTIDDKQIILFFDELPWLDSPKSNFLTAFTHFWNSWAATRDGLKLFVCGSATTWMLNKIVGDKGGLYGRCSRAIYLAPFNLGEVEQFIQKQKGINWNRYQIIEAYMIFGGIPYYLNMLDRQLTFKQNIDILFFKHGAPLKDEYDFLFRSLFKNANIYRQVVELLSKKNKGLSLSEIRQELKMSMGGALSKVLDELCKCDFLRKYHAFEKKERDVMYQLVDHYSLFYLHFVHQQNPDEHFWSNLQQTKHNAWAGYAFEQVCLHHIEQIRMKLGINGVLVNVCSWTSPHQIDKNGVEWNGAQIDLLISRADSIIDICEIKYSSSEYIITADYAATLRSRMQTFRHFTKTKYATRNILITTYGLRQGLYSDAIDAVVAADDLFRLS